MILDSQIEYSMYGEPRASVTGLVCEYVVIHTKARLAFWVRRCNYGNKNVFTLADENIGDYNCCNFGALKTFPAICLWRFATAASLLVIRHGTSV